MFSMIARILIARSLIARIPQFSHISTFMTEQLHSLPLPAPIHFKIIFLVYKAFLGLVPSYLCKLIMRPLSAISDRPLRSLVRNDLLVLRSRTSTSQQCAFASAGPLLWNCLHVKTRAMCNATQIICNWAKSILGNNFLNSFCSVFVDSLQLVPHQRFLTWSRIVRDHKVSKFASDCFTSTVLEVVKTQLAKLFNITRFRSSQEFYSFERGDIMCATFWSGDIIGTGYFCPRHYDGDIFTATFCSRYFKRIPTESSESAYSGWP